MGGGMGISQGASYRLVTSRTKMAMPETAIGLFPDVGGGYFLSRCPGFSGEWLALTGITLGAGDSLALGLADHCVDEVNLERLWVDLSQMDFVDNTQFDALIASHCVAANALLTGDRSQIDRYFALDSVIAIIRALEADDSDWAQQTATLLRQRSPLMLHVAFEQIRRARKLSIAQDLRMERGVMRHCFYPAHLQRKGSATEVAEGIRARVIGKDNAPLWQPSRIEDVTPEMVQPFFASPWPEQSHPLLLLV
jgi:enoyl-CoA hydratase/carnithine racemase